MYAIARHAVNLLAAAFCASALAAAPADDAPRPDAAPTAEQCKAGYPPGAQVDGVTPIGFADIAPAQAAQTAGAPPPRNTTLGNPAPSSSAEPAELRQGLKVSVAQLAALLKLLECPGKKRALVLFLAGRPLPGLTAYPPTDPARDTIYFVLERTEANYDAWTSLLGRPSFDDRAINVSVGFDDSYPIPSSSTIGFRTIPHGWAAGWAALTLAFAVLVVWAARVTPMLRDHSDSTAMYSLGRIQLVFWTFLVLASFMLIGMVTGDYLHSMNEKVLALMGISAGTTLGASVIDDGSAAVPRTVYPSTGRWWRDILSDGTGVSIHRFQMVAWTIVLGVVFLHQVYSRLSMPDLPATLLGLMGLSAGTYLGLKITAEK